MDTLLPVSFVGGYWHLRQSVRGRVAEAALWADKSLVAVRIVSTPRISWIT
jgi:hypothetical protein